MKSKPWGCAHYSAIALMCFALLCYAAWECLFRSVPLRISPETTYITEPLDASGKWVDYFRAMELKLYPAEMKTDENGVRIITRALGIGEEKSPEFVEIYYEKLGLDPSMPPTHSFVPWDDEGSLPIEDWLHDNSPALDIIAEAAAKPAFMFPLVRLRDDAVLTMLKLELPEMQATREYARGLLIFSKI